MDAPLAHFTRFRQRPSRAQAFGPAQDVLAHRRPRLVWASGEDFCQNRMSAGSELLRHGLSEWAGIRKPHTLGGVAQSGLLTALDVDGLAAALEPHDVFEDLPIVVCRDPRVPALLQERCAAPDGLVLGILAAPRASRAHGMARSLIVTPLPVPAPQGVTPGDVAWLGAPERLCHPVPGVSSGPSLLVDGRGLTAESVPFYLDALARHLQRRQAQRLWLVVCVDGFQLGRSEPGLIDDEVLACTLRWMQQLLLDPLVFLLSHEPAAPGGARLGEAARHIGQALFRHPDFR